MEILQGCTVLRDQEAGKIHCEASLFSFLSSRLPVQLCRKQARPGVMELTASTLPKVLRKR